jgi:hypothetical protein
MLQKLGFLKQKRMPFAIDCCDAPGQGLRSFTLFNTVIENAIKEEVVAECAGCRFLLPCLCQFLISDVNQVHQLVPEPSCEGFNLLVIDPPWENKSVHRRAL